MRATTVHGGLLVSCVVAVVAVPLASIHGPREQRDVVPDALSNATNEVLKMKVEPFEWAMCGDPSDPLQVHSASLSPYPIKFSKDRQLPITLALNGTLSVDVREGSYDMILKKKVPYINSWQKIPCIDDYGSCSYDLCDGCINIFGPVCDKWFTDHNIPCHCPFLTQDFTVEQSTLLLPAAGPVPAWLADGDFQVELTFNDKAGKRVGCIFLQISLLIVK